jgi:hypothetical protein
VANRDVVLLLNSKNEPEKAEYGAVIDLYENAIKSLRDYKFIIFDKSQLLNQ